MEPLSFDFKLAEFDLSLLPVDAEFLKGNEAMLRSTLERYLREVFDRLPGERRLTQHEDRISVTWLAESSRDVDPLINLGASLIRQRAFGTAETILRTLFSRNAVDRRVLFSLGALLCEQGRVQEARGILRRLTRTAPDFADGWNALGVALSREGKREEASSAFRKSLSLAPNNGYTMRNLGALMAGKDPQAALPYLKRAAKLLPSDQAAQYTYAKSLMDTGSPSDADAGLKRAIALNERSEIADLCREARMKIVRTKLKGAIPRGLRAEVVLFCLAALEAFKEMGREGAKAVVYEVASLAGRGLNINDPTSRFRLVSLPGKFSALQLVVYMYVGVKRTAPRRDPGIDFSREYAFALAMLPGKKKKSSIQRESR